MRPTIILGPPGTGKTTTLLRRVEESLARGVSPERIGYFSFTRKASEEAISRACEKFKREREDFPYFRTLHSLCYRFLGLSTQDVMDGRATQDFAAFAGVTVRGRWAEDGDLSQFAEGDRILFMDNLARVRRIPLREQYNQSPDDMPWNLVRRTSESLREFKRSRGIIDYTDMLTEFVRQGARPALDELYVDEGQDLSHAQWEVVRAMAEGCPTTVAGDDDQAIYRWAGADVDQFVRMEGEVSVLDQSYRVPQAIQEVASRAIARVRERREKTWHPRAERGTVDRAPLFEYADTSGQDVLILARNDYVLREQVEPELRRRGVLFEKHGQLSVKQGTLDVIGSWERLRSGGAVPGAEARRVYESMSGGRGVERGRKQLEGVDDEEDVTMTQLRERHGLLTDAIWHEALDRIPLREREYIVAMRRHGESLKSRPRIRLSTIHGAKGGQADHVILMREMAARTHREMDENAEDEARVWYVAATRAKERLTMVESSTHRYCPWI